MRLTMAVLSAAIADEWKVVVHAGVLQLVSGAAEHTLLAILSANFGIRSAGRDANEAFW